MRLIDAEFLLTDIMMLPHNGDMISSAEVEQAILEAPTIEAQPVVHGEWIGTQYDGYADGCPVYDTWECSECREEYESEGDPPDFRYCPNCGAKMDGGDQGE